MPDLKRDVQRYFEEYSKNSVIQDNPALSISYSPEITLSNRYSRSDNFMDIELTYEEKLTTGQKFIKDIFEVLEAYPKAIGLSREQYHFKMNLLVPHVLNGFNSKTAYPAVSIIIGTTKSLSKEEGKLVIDDYGSHVLSKGVELGQYPMLVSANYNFSPAKDKNTLDSIVIPRR